LYVEVGGHWLLMTSRNIDDATLSRMAESAVRNPDGTALIPTAGLLGGLTLVLRSDAPADFLGMGSDFAGLSYANGDGRSISLQIYPSRPSSRANLGLQASFTATKVAGANGFVGSYSVESSVPPFHAQLLSWERGGLDFRVTGFNVSAAEVLAAAESVERASDAAWDDLLRKAGGGQRSAGVAPAGTAPAEPAPAGTDPPFTGDVRDVVIDVSVSNPSPSEQVWSGTLPSGETWEVDVTRVFDSIAMKPKVDGAGQGMTYGPLARAAGQELGCCAPLNVITSDPNAKEMRVTTHRGDRFTIRLRDLPGTGGLRMAVIALPNGGGPQAAELIDGNGNVLRSLPGGS
jgi:hypothetical protein